MGFTILIIDDEEEMCISLSEILSSEGYRAIYTTNPLNGPEILNKHPVCLIIMDIRMPQLGGIDLLKRIKESNHYIPVIMITGYPSIENAVRAMKYGALNFYVKPLNISELLDEIKQIVNSQKTKKKGLSNKYRIITNNPKMAEIKKNVKKVALTDASVLILGESGTGEILKSMVFLLKKFKKYFMIPYICQSLIKDSVIWRNAG